MMKIDSIRLLLLATLAGAGCTSTSAQEASFIPERFNKSPRILFNLNDSKETIANEIIPGEYYQDFWQGVRLTIIRGRMIKSEKASFDLDPSYHGEELIIMLSGQLTFSFPGNGRSYTIKKGDVFHFNNVLHTGTCESEECYYVAVLSPPRLDYGEEDKPSEKYNYGTISPRDSR